MSDPLLIAATPELLEGWNGPVLAADGVPGVLVGPDQRPEDERRGLWVVCPVGEWPDLEGTDYSEMPMSCLTSEVFLDLRRAECRDRVARVLLAGLVDDNRTANPRFRPSKGGWLPRPSRLVLGPLCRYSGPVLDDDYTQLPALADLDPADDTRLADGSRRVDALALAMAAREVCGV